MKLIFKGSYNDLSKPPRVPDVLLPANAVKIKNQNSSDGSQRRDYFFMIPAIAMIGVFVLCSFLLHGKESFTNIRFSVWGLILSFFSVVPHEMIHAVSYGRNATVDFYYNIKHFTAFVISNAPLSRWRLVLTYALPNLILGWLPLLIWTLIPYNELFSNALLTYSFFVIIYGCGDYMGIYDTLRNVPKNAIVQNSGSNSYWYINT